MNWNRKGNLPPSGQRVLVLVTEIGLCVGVFEKTSGKWTLDVKEWPVEKITHWIDLPKRFPKTMKTCPECKIRKLLSEFYLGKDGRISGYCKSCFVKYVKEYNYGNEV